MPTTSGVKVSDQCVSNFKEMQQKHKQRCIIYVIEGEKEFSIYEQIGKGNGDQKKEFDAIVEKMKLDPHLFGPSGSEKESCEKRNPCVVVWDLNVPSEGKANKDVLLFMKVCPDEGITVKKKMVLASSIQDLKDKLTGIMKSLDISSMDELIYERVLDAMK